MLSMSCKVKLPTIQIKLVVIEEIQKTELKTILEAVGQSGPKNGVNTRLYIALMKNHTTNGQVQNRDPWSRSDDSDECPKSEFDSIQFHDFNANFAKNNKRNRIKSTMRMMLMTLFIINKKKRWF